MPNPPAFSAVLAPVLGLVLGLVPGLGPAPAAARQQRPARLPADMVWTDEDPTPRTGVPPATGAIVYVNMDGPILNPGPNNSRENTSQLVPNANTKMTPFKSQDPVARAELMRCTKILFGRFGVTVTDQDPGPGVQHIEAVVTGATSAEIGRQSSNLGVSPFSCGYIASSIVFVFGAYYGNDVPQVCETVGQEVAHSFGLEHEALCEDPMTYDGGCGVKQFQDADAPCGEHERDPMDCDCEVNQASNTQNSVRRLLALLGPGETIAPTVSQLEPADGASIAGATIVRAAAADDNLVVKVELFLDGAKLQEDLREPYEFPLPRNLALGAHTIRLVASDPAGNLAETTSTLNVDAQCSTDAECDAAAGETCAGHYCARTLGGLCETQDECSPGLLCGVEAEEQRCTRSCGTGLEACPSGFGCLEGDVAGIAKCWPSTGGGGGCAATPGRAAGASIAGSLGLLGLLGLFRARRRARRRVRH